MFAIRQSYLRITPWTCHTCRSLSTSARKQLSERRESQRLPKSPARTRFAPSPTGYLHLGSLRTALYNYLLAKATGGQFILRVENTDSKRTIPGAEERLYRDLEWAGLQWDEGPEIGGPYGPYKQSERTALYQDHSRQLLQSHNAYRCFCSPGRLNNLAQHRNQYDGACRLISTPEAEERAEKGEAHVIRLKTPERPPEFVDLVYGKVGKQKLGSIAAATPGGLSFEDPILLKSDGMPTYHLANVVDDHHMNITHVIRATEWMSSTPKHLVIYKAFNWEPPSFAHVGLLQDLQQQKISKRDHGEASLDLKTFQDKGVFPEALVNYVSLFGWSHQRPTEVMDMQELINAFDLKFTKGNTVVNPEKLEFFQNEYASKYIHGRGAMFEHMKEKIRSIVEQNPQYRAECDIAGARSLRERIASALQHCGHSYSGPQHFYDSYFYYFRSLEPKDYFSDTVSGSRRLLVERHNGEWTLKNNAKLLPLTINETASHYMGVTIDKLKGVSEDDWNALQLHQSMASILNDVGPHAQMVDSAIPQKHLDFHLFLRWALTAGWSGPSNVVSMEILGKAISLRRLTDASTTLLKHTQSPQTVSISACTI